MAESFAISLRVVARWAAVLPVSALCALAAQFPIHWFVMLINHFGRRVDEGGVIDVALSLAALPMDVLELFGYALFFPFIVIAVGARIAPRLHLETGIALAVLVGVYIGFTAQQIVSDVQEGLYTPGRWLRLGVTVILWVVSFTWGMASAKQSATVKGPEFPEIMVEVTVAIHAGNRMIGAMVKALAWEIDGPKAVTGAPRGFLNKNGFLVFHFSSSEKAQEFREATAFYSPWILARVTAT